LLEHGLDESELGLDGVNECLVILNLKDDGLILSGEVGVGLFLSGKV
jgi:hypothetical protein